MNHLPCSLTPHPPPCPRPSQLTGEPLPRVHYFGKPHAAPYRLIEQLLLRQAQRLGLGLPQEAAEAALAAAEAGSEAHWSSGSSGGSSGSSGNSGGGSGTQQARAPLPFSAIYAVGDNPAADVRGANAAGAPWVSVLVTKTGVATANSPADPAQVSSAARPAGVGQCLQAAVLAVCALWPASSSRRLRLLPWCVFNWRRRTARVAPLPFCSPLTNSLLLFYPNQSVHWMQVVVDDVEAAVEAGLHRARFSKWHSMR